MGCAGEADSGPVQAAGAVVYRGDREIPEFLLLRNSLHLTWAPPKGHLEPGESHREGARRELAEELGEQAFLLFQDGFTRTLAYRVPGPDGPRTKEVTYYLARLADGEITLSSEHDARLWAGLDTALATLEHQDLRQLIREAAAFLKESP